MSDGQGVQQVQPSDESGAARPLTKEIDKKTAGVVAVAVAATAVAAIAVVAAVTAAVRVTPAEVAGMAE